MAPRLRRHGAHRGLSDFHCDRERLLHDAERAAMARTPLDHVDGRLGNEASISAALGPMFWARAWHAR